MILFCLLIGDRCCCMASKISRARITCWKKRREIRFWIQLVLSPWELINPVSNIHTRPTMSSELSGLERSRANTLANIDSGSQLPSRQCLSIINTAALSAVPAGTLLISTSSSVLAPHVTSIFPLSTFCKYYLFMLLLSSQFLSRPSVRVCLFVALHLQPTHPFCFLSLYFPSYLHCLPFSKQTRIFFGNSSSIYKRIVLIHIKGIVISYVVRRRDIINVNFVWSLLCFFLLPLT